MAQTLRRISRFVSRPQRTFATAQTTVSSRHDKFLPRKPHRVDQLWCGLGLELVSFQKQSFSANGLVHQWFWGRALRALSQVELQPPVKALALLTETETAPRQGVVGGGCIQARMAGWPLL